jgi:hypothetical protein
MSEAICPYLERRVEGGKSRFYCGARGGAPVDPALAPCLLGARERAGLCPDYAKTALRDLAARAAARAERLAA